MKANKRPLFSYTTEDPALLRALTSERVPAHALCICSGGETVMNLIALGCRQVTTVDISDEQLALAAAKLAAKRVLRDSEFLQFLAGPQLPSQRLNGVLSQLSTEHMQYWTTTGYLKGGAIWSGSLAKYLRVARFAIRGVLGRRLFQELLHLGSQKAASVEFFQSLRVRFLLRFLCSPRIFARWYPTVRLADQSGSLPTRDMIYARLREIVDRKPLASNPIVRLLLEGKFSPEITPPYVTCSPELFLDAEVRMVLGDITDIGSSSTPVGKFDLVVLCNVFDWLGSDGTKKLLQHLRLHSSGAARLIMYSRDADAEMLFQLAPTRCWAVDRQASLSLTTMDNTGYHCAVVLFRAA